MHVLRPSALFSAFVFLAGTSAQITLQGPTNCTISKVYTLCQNLWGAGELHPSYIEDIAALIKLASWRERRLEDMGVGSQTSTLNSVSGDSVSWRRTIRGRRIQHMSRPVSHQFFILGRPTRPSCTLDPNVYHNTAKGMKVWCDVPHHCLALTSRHIAYSFKTSSPPRRAGSGTTILLRMILERMFRT